jgi:hypothetical protein
MAELHLAMTTGLGGFERLVVVKRLKAALASAPDWVQGLLDEARIAARLQHGNIVQVHDVALEGGAVSIVMEYLHGHDVRTLLRRAASQLPGGVLPLEQSIAIALGVCAGLHHAHDQVDGAGKPLGIVHRDVSADNVFVTYDGGVKLIDFGIARAHSRLGQTEVGVTKGKPGYMAPEQILCAAIDRRVDVHAAAVLLYEMTCGRLPRIGESDYALFNATVETDAIPPRAVVADYPPELEAIVLRGLARDPAARFESALEMQRALETFAQRGKLDLSSFGLARLMEGLFRDKLEAWRAAQQQGKSLADHVAAVKRSTMAHMPGADGIAVEPPGGMVPTTAARAPRRFGVAYALLGVVLIAAVGLGAWRAGMDEPRDPTPVPTKADVPETVTPPPAPTPSDTAGAAPAPAPAVADDPERDEPEEIVLDPEPVEPEPEPAPAPVAAEPPATAEPDRPVRRRAVEKARDKRRRKQPAGDARVATPPRPTPEPEPDVVDPDDPTPR